MSFGAGVGTGEGVASDVVAADVVDDTWSNFDAGAVDEADELGTAADVFTSDGDADGVPFLFVDGLTDESEVVASLPWSFVLPSDIYISEDWVQRVGTYV